MHLKAQKHKMLIFSQRTKVLDLLEYYLSERGHEVCRIDGGVKLEERKNQIKDFNDPDSKSSIFLLSTRTGGLGINLTTADTCIIYDSDWNPQMDMQAMDRCHRIGQKKPVHVYRLITAHSVEESNCLKENLLSADMLKAISKPCYFTLRFVSLCLQIYITCC